MQTLTATPTWPWPFHVRGTAPHTTHPPPLLPHTPHHPPRYEAVLRWTGLPVYDPAGRAGFRDRADLGKVLGEKHNVASKSADRQKLYDEEVRCGCGWASSPVRSNLPPPHTHTLQVVPNLNQTEEAFRMHNKYLHLLLAGTEGDGSWGSVSALLKHTGGGGAQSGA